MVNIWPLIAHLIGERCALCGVTASGLCDDCRRELPRNGSGCRCCAVPLPAAADPALPCARCQRHPPSFSTTVAALQYRAPADRLIAALKYRNDLPLARPLADCLVETLTRTRVPAGAWPQQLVPVPMPPTRLRERGYNQAIEIARIVGRSLAIPVARGVAARPVDALTQRGRSRSARHANVRNAFIARREPAPHVAIVDDVMTTGATAESLSRTLRAAGAAHVEVWVVARTPAPPF